MTKQLLIYSNVTPLNRRDHAELAYKAVQDYGFARQVNAAPLVTGEFMAASGDFAVVFAPGGEVPLPVALFGVEAEHNVYVDADGKWLAGYVPAFLRRFPFVFSTDAVGETYTLCIDDTAPGFNRDGRGERLFDSDGVATGFTNRMLDFLKEFQAQHERTKAFAAKLVELDLLQSVEAHIPLPGQPARTLTGFQVVNREKLRALPAETIEPMFRGEELELIYLHLFSLRNLDHLRERAAQAMEQAAA